MAWRVVHHYRPFLPFYVFSYVFQLFKSLRVQLEMRRRQVEAALQSTQRDGMLTVDQALVKQAWERVSNRVRVRDVLD